MNRPKTTKCKHCCRTLRLAYLPDRGATYVHAPGAGEFCRRLLAAGRAASQHNQETRHDER